MIGLNLTNAALGVRSGSSLTSPGSQETPRRLGRQGAGALGSRGFQRADPHSNSSSLFSSPELGVTPGGSLGTAASHFQAKGRGPGPSGPPWVQAPAPELRRPVLGQRVCARRRDGLSLPPAGSCHRPRPPEPCPPQAAATSLGGGREDGGGEWGVAEGRIWGTDSGCSAGPRKPAPGHF